MPDGVPVAFPDDIPPEQIKSLIATKFPDAVKSINPESQPASQWPMPGSPAAEFGRKLGALWDNPPPGGLVSTVKPIAQAVNRLMQVGHGDIPITDDSGHTSPQVIEDSLKAATIASPMTAAPTNPNLLRAIGNPLGLSPSQPTALPESLAAAQNIGVDLPRAISTDSPTLRFAGQVANRMPGGGPMQEAVANAVKQTGDAVGRAADLAGGASDAMAAGQGFRAGIENSFKPTMKARVGDAYDEVDKLVDPEFTRPLVATQKAVADITERRRASGETDPGKAVRTVLGGATREGPTESKTILAGPGYHIAEDVPTPGGLTFQGVKDLRTRVGEMLDTGVFPEGMSQGELRRIYGALSDDLKATAAAAGGEGATKALTRANAMNKFVEDWKDNLGKVLGSDRSGEGITAAIQRMASDGPSGDIKALTMARAAVPKEVWQDVAATAIGQLGKDRKGEFSPSIFMNDFANLSDRGKALLFNDVGSGKVLPYLNDIAAVSKKFVDAGKLANTSGTAGHNAAFTLVGAGATGLYHGSLIEPISAITLVLGNNLMARALSSPASAASIARWSRVYDALANNPGSKSIAAFNIASRNVANTVNGQFGSNINPGSFLKAIQGTQRSAADPNQKN